MVSVKLSAGVIACRRGAVSLLKWQNRTLGFRSTVIRCRVTENAGLLNNPESNLSNIHLAHFDVRDFVSRMNSSEAYDYSLSFLYASDILQAVAVFKGRSLVKADNGGDRTSANPRVVCITYCNGLITVFGVHCSSPKHRAVTINPQPFTLTTTSKSFLNLCCTRVLVGV